MAETLWELIQELRGRAERRRGKLEYQNQYQQTIAATEELCANRLEAWARAKAKEWESAILNSRDAGYVIDIHKVLEDLGVPEESQ